jgi:hypothetical protein
MASPTANLHVQIVRFVIDHQPPIVACEFVDADGQKHTVVDKVWMFSEETPSAQSHYPKPGEIRCGVVSQWRDSEGRDVVRINTADPDQIESIEGLTEFTVLRDLVAEASSSVNEQ